MNPDARLQLRRNAGMFCALAALAACSGSEPELFAGDGGGGDGPESFGATQGTNVTSTAVGTGPATGTGTGTGGAATASSGGATSGGAAGGEGGAAATVCGDGRLEGDEACDDGDDDDDDGCTGCVVDDGYRCEGEPSTCGEVCGEAFPVAPDGLQLEIDSLYPYGDDFVVIGGGCAHADEVESSRPEAVFLLDLVAGERVEVGVAGADVNVHILDGVACDPNAACAASAGWEEVWLDGLGFTAPSATSALLVVENAFPDEPYALVLDVERALCGDGDVRAFEECDDGAAAAGDGCDELCRIETHFACDGEPSTCEPLAGTRCDDSIAIEGEGAIGRPPASAYGDDIDLWGVSGCGSTLLSPDVVVEVSLDDGEWLQIVDYAWTEEDVSDSSYSAQTTCGGDSCVASGNLSPVGVFFPDEPGTYFIVVEHRVEAPILSVGYEIGRCGDGQFGGSEVCDDGNRGPGDGCDGRCQVEVVDDGWTCARDYQTDSLCDCGCGIYDEVGCEDGFEWSCYRCPDGSCAQGESFDDCLDWELVDDDNATCNQSDDAPPPPPAWTCAPERQLDDVCDCGCGIHDAAGCESPDVAACEACPQGSCAFFNSTTEDCIDFFLDVDDNASCG